MRIFVPLAGVCCLAAWCASSGQHSRIGHGGEPTYVRSLRSQLDSCCNGSIMAYKQVKHSEGSYAVTSNATMMGFYDTSPLGQRTTGTIGTPSMTPEGVKALA